MLSYCCCCQLIVDICDLATRQQLRNTGKATKWSTFLCHLSPCKSQNHLSYKHESIKWIRGRLPNHQLLPSSTSFNNLYGQYLPAGGPLPLAAPQATGLIPVMHKLGSKLNIKTFCIIFYLLDSIQQQLKENAYTRTHAFTHMEMAELWEMGFKAGEIADLKEAVKEWAVPKHKLYFYFYSACHYTNSLCCKNITHFKSNPHV